MNFKKLIIAFILAECLTMSAKAATPMGTIGTSAVIKIGETTIVQDGTIRPLVCEVLSNSKCSFRKPNTSVGYTPSGSNKFYVYGIFVMCSTSACQEGLLYSDNDLGVSSATSPTNSVYWTGSSSTIFTANAATTAPRDPGYAIEFYLPNGKYLGINAASGGAIVWVWGKEAP